MHATRCVRTSPAPLRFAILCALGLAMLAGRAAASPGDREIAGTETELVSGIVYSMPDRNGVRIAARADRLSWRDRRFGFFYLRPFAEAILEGVAISITRSSAATASTKRETNETVAARESTALLGRLARSLAGREVVSFHVRDLTIAVDCGDTRQLTLTAKAARVRKEESALALEELYASDATGQTIAAAAGQFNWEPESLRIRGPFRVCEEDGCRGGSDAEFTLDLASSRLVAGTSRSATPTSRATNACDRPESKRRHEP